MKDHSHLIPIFNRYLNNECSPNEVAELLAYFRVGDDHQLLRSLILKQLENPVDSTSTEEPVDDNVFQSILASIYKQVSLPEKHFKATPTRFPYWTVGIAASLVIVSFVGLYVYQNPKQPVEYVGNKKSQAIDVAPGGNKASLTLADGSIILLDGSKNGQVAKQKHAIVNKTRDGEVAYQSNQGALSAAVEYNTISTPRGGQYAVVLPDGTKVWLNAASTLKFPVAFTGAERRVELTGEGYFEVAKNKQKPFKVMINGATVEVLGTHFNVMAYSEEDITRTTLLEGSVKIVKNNSSGILKPGQQADIDKIDHIRISEANTAQAMAWKNGYFEFDKDDIQVIMRQLSRWYNIDVVYEGRVPDDKFVGKIRRSVNISEVLQVLKLSKVHFKMVNKKIVITNNF